MQTLGFEIFDMLGRAHLTGQAIYIAAKLRIADYLKDGAKSVDELAVQTETHPDSLYRLLRMLASIGIFTEIKEENDKQEQSNQRIRRRFELTPMASLLQSETENSIRNFALMFGLESFKKSIDDLSYSIQTGENSFKHANGLEMYEYFEQNQEEAQIFNGAMASLTSSHASLILSMYDFSQFNTIIDIGGGQGTFLSSILKNNPNLHGVLFDLPHAIETAKKLYAKELANVKDNNVDVIFPRCKLLEGDFFKSIPSVGADGYIIKNVILNWDDESAAIILKNCLQAMKGTSSSSSSNENQTNRRKTSPKLLIIDTVMPEGNEPFIGKFTDILMLALTHKGRIRTETEFHKLLDSCGFEIANIIRSHDSTNFLSIIEAVPSSN
jgi:O-methyltransferase domain